MNLKVVFKALLTKLCNCDNIHKNGQFQLFGADVIKRLLDKAEEECDCTEQGDETNGQE